MNEFCELFWNGKNVIRGCEVTLKNLLQLKWSFSSFFYNFQPYYLSKMVYFANIFAPLFYYFSRAAIPLYACVTF